MLRRMIFEDLPRRYGIVWGNIRKIEKKTGRSGGKQFGNS
jgi:hypothetical protein